MGYNPPPPQRQIESEDSVEKTLQRIDSLERVHGLRKAGMEWESEWERHRQEFMVKRLLVSPPPPPWDGFEWSQVTDVERR